jgi:hypothetical protein
MRILPKASVRAMRIYKMAIRKSPHPGAFPKPGILGKGFPSWDQRFLTAVFPAIKNRRTRKPYRFTTNFPVKISFL